METRHFMEHLCVPGDLGFGTWRIKRDMLVRNKLGALFSSRPKMSRKIDQFPPGLLGAKLFTVLQGSMSGHST